MKQKIFVRLRSIEELLERFPLTVYYKEGKLCSFNGLGHIRLQQFVAAAEGPLFVEPLPEVHEGYLVYINHSKYLWPKWACEVRKDSVDNEPIREDVDMAMAIQIEIVGSPDPSLASDYRPTDVVKSDSHLYVVVNDKGHNRFVSLRTGPHYAAGDACPSSLELARPEKIGRLAVVCE